VSEIREVASGLQFPEGPIAMPDGSVIVVEIRRGTLTRVTPEGKVEILADLGGGPNGAAVGPGGAVYVCNNGGFTWSEIGDMVIPMSLPDMTNEPEGFEGGWIDRVDLATGEHTVLYTECDGHRFRSPNDIVFDSAGGFFFTDLGKVRARDIDRGALYYARADGSSVTCVAYGLYGPNGTGLSPDGSKVYVAESYTGRLLAWSIDTPGSAPATGTRGECLAATRGHFDSLAVEADGKVAVAAIGNGVCRIDPSDGTYEYVDIPDPFTTNICFGGDDRRTAYVTGSGGGKLFALDWAAPGLALNF
jgi:gluconolactonase